MAQALIKETFEIADDTWRGMGEIKSSGLKLKEEFYRFDIEKIYPITKENNYKIMAPSVGRY
jgi:hydrogenase expression/formation protein HypD